MSQQNLPGGPFLANLEAGCYFDRVRGIGYVSSAVPEQNGGAKAAGITVGLMSLQQAAADLSCTERAIIRFERAGMPVIRIGRSRFYDPFAVREWLLTRPSVFPFGASETRRKND